MKKRWTCLFLAVVMVLSLCLTACGNGAKETTPPETQAAAANAQTPTEAATEAAKEPELEPATIQMWLLGPGKQKDSDKVWEAFNEKLQEYVPNTTVEFEVMPGGEYGEKFTQMLASGEAVDLAWAGWLVEKNNNSKNGNFYPMNDLLAQYGQGIVETLGEDVIDIHRYTDGELYYLISWQGLYGNRLGFRIPNELAAIAGDTWLDDFTKIVDKWWNNYESVDDYQAVFDQLDIYFKALQDNDKLYSGIYMQNCFEWNLATRHDLTGTAFNGTAMIGVLDGDDTFTAVDPYQTEHFRCFAKNAADFYKKGYVRSDIASVDTSALQFVTNHEYTPNTLVIKAHQALTEADQAQETAAAGTDVTIVPVQDRGFKGKGDGTAMCIPYCSDQPERAMMVLNALYTQPDLYQLLIYGFEGEHYTDNGDGTITTPYGDQGNEESDYGLWKWTIGTCANSLTTQADTPGMYDMLVEAEKTAKISPFLGFVFDETEVAGIISAQRALINEYVPVIANGIQGDKWEATLDEFIAKRQAAGLDELIAEYQRQLDEYIAANNIKSW